MLKVRINNDTRRKGEYGTSCGPFLKSAMEKNRRTSADIKQQPNLKISCNYISNYAIMARTSGQYSAK
jgi:hypothetical protein